MKPNHFRCFIEFPYSTEDDVYTRATDQLHNLGQMTQVGVISSSTAASLMDTIFNGASRLREFVVSVKLYDMIVQADGDMGRLSYNQRAGLWDAGIQKSAIENSFFNANLKMAIPVYLEYDDVPSGFEITDNALPVVKTLISEGHKFNGEIFAVTNEIFSNESLFLEQHDGVGKSKVLRFNLRFQDEGDMIVVTAFKDEYDRKMNDFREEGRAAMSGFAQTASTIRNQRMMRRALGLGQSSIQQGGNLFKKPTP